MARRRLPRAWGAVFLVTMALVTSSSARAADSGRVHFNRDIRPILSDNCFYCHGPDPKHRDGKFRLDERDSTIAKKAITPGKPAESEMIARIFTADEDDLMPPPKSHKKLSAEQKELIKRWIEEGAEYQPHWAYITPAKPTAPTAKESGWVRNPIDAFVLSGLEARKLPPSKEADKRTLLRRLSLDLIGLPPTPAEVQAFLDDPSPEAYEKQVDRLLASPHYGERMAVPWLDVVRFADTVGFHGDQNQNVFPYRDYVIDAFNANKPFDRFTVEQIAGDLLPNPTTEQLIATGFNRLNMMTREGGAQPKEYLAKYAADRVRTVGTAFLGSTFGCAECHDHKFDPITAADFYSMAAYFADVKQWGVYTDYPYTPNPDLAGFSNNHPFPPEIVIDSPALQRRLNEKRAKLASTIASIGQEIRGDAKRSAAFEKWKTDAAAFLNANSAGWLPAEPVKESLPEKSNVEADGSVLLAGKMADDRLEFALPAGDVAAFRIELLPHASHKGSIARQINRAARTPEILFNATLVGAQNGKVVPVRIDRADADFKAPVYENGYEVIGVGRQWSASGEHLDKAQTAVYVLQTPLNANAGDKLTFNFKQLTAGCIRISVSPVAVSLPPASGFAESLKTALASESGEELSLLTYLNSTADERDARGRVSVLQREIDDCRGGKSPTLITQAWEPRTTRILPRGNWQDDSGPVVEPTPPHFLPQGEKVAGRRATRLDLANWIVSADNPLTSRTVVNRFWKQFFGNGLCNTVDDLGAQGEWPSHPELLDWLAVEFRESGWDVKHVVRLMVTSSTYRQDSNLRPELRESDPANRLLSAQSPRRLEAEFVRDNALFAAGLLNLVDIGGPSAKPYQPAGYYENIQFPSRDYPADTDDRQYRRGLYSHWQRTFLHPMLANFDAPSREDCTAVRVVSNTPQQALTLLNDPSFVEAAIVLAQHAITGGKADDARLDFVFARVLARQPSAKERESLTKFLAEQRKLCAADPAESAKLAKAGMSPVPDGTDLNELAAWTNVCRVVLNLHESITRY